MQFTRTRRSNLDAAPNQIATASAQQPILLVGYRIYNPNSSDAFVGAYNNTSGVVTVGTTSADYGKLLVPTNSEVIDRTGTKENPLASFDTAMTFFATTAEPVSSSTSPTLDLTIELFYYT